MTKEYLFRASTISSEFNKNKKKIFPSCRKREKEKKFAYIRSGQGKLFQPCSCIRSDLAKIIKRKVKWGIPYFVYFSLD